MAAGNKKTNAREPTSKLAPTPSPVPGPGILAAGRKTKRSWEGSVFSYLSPEMSITKDLLTKLRTFTKIQPALRWLKQRHPDTSQALFNFLNLAGNGHRMEIYALDGKTRLTDTESRWNELASRVYAVSNDGLDGLVSQLIESALIDNGMGMEVEIGEDLDDIVDFHPIDPQQLRWKLEKRNGKNVLIPYQVVGVEWISLENANFFWIPSDPDYDDPTGNPPFSSLIAAADFQLQTDQDKQAVLHNQGWPRYDVAINRESVVASAPPDAKADMKKLTAYMNNIITDLQSAYGSLNADDAFIHFDDVTPKVTDGATSNSRGMDVRAIDEGVDRRVMGALKQLSAFLNRTAGATETWSSVQFKIFCLAIKGLQRKVKRLIESAAKLTLRVWGIQGIPRMVFEEVDHENEKGRLEIKKLQAELWTWYYLLGFIEQDDAAMALVDHEAVAEPIAIPKTFSTLQEEDPEGGSEGGGDGGDGASGNGNYDGTGDGGDDEE